MFSRPKILFLVSLLFVALLNPKFNPYLLFKFLIFYHSSNYVAIMPFSSYSKSIELLELWKMRSIQVDNFSISIILLFVVILFALIYIFNCKHTYLADS